MRMWACWRGATSKASTPTDAPSSSPRAVVVEPGHDAWVVGEQGAVLIQFDAEDETARHFGLPEEHRHLNA